MGTVAGNKLFIFSSVQADGDSISLQRVIAGKQRSAEHKSRDILRAVKFAENKSG